MARNDGGPPMGMMIPIALALAFILHGVNYHGAGGVCPDCEADGVKVHLAACGSEEVDWYVCHNCKRRWTRPQGRKLLRQRADGEKEEPQETPHAEP